MAEAFHVAGQHDHENGSSPKRRRLEDDTGWGPVQGMQLKHHHLHHHHHHDRKRSPEELLAHMSSKYHLRKAKVFTSAEEAMQYATELYCSSVGTIKECLQDFAGGASSLAIHERTTLATYPFVGTQVDVRDMDGSRTKYAAYGVVKEPGYYGVTITRPDVLGNYYSEQLGILVERYCIPLVVGLSEIPIPLPFAIGKYTHDISKRKQFEIYEAFTFPDLIKITDDLANGSGNASASHVPGLRPLSLFNADRVDLSLQRLAHYCGTDLKYYQGFILLTNYQRYIDEFITWGQKQVMDPSSGYTLVVGPHDTLLADAKTKAQLPAEAVGMLPQMPAYHLVREDGMGITFINIGVGPSNAKTITDHLAVLRPHCWMMLGHCAGLRVSQNLGDYVLAHAYVREDHVLDQEVPLWVPLPPIAEVQTALQSAVAGVLGRSGLDVKSAMRTGTLVTTDNRDWELRANELRQRFKQSRAIGVDMESATIAANGFRFRVPYGTLLCVSDKPIHGELKLQGMANEFYRQRVSEHLHIGLEAVRLLREQGVQRLQSRKLRGFDEPPFR